MEMRFLSIFFMGSYIFIELWLEQIMYSEKLSRFNENEMQLVANDDGQGLMLSVDVIVVLSRFSMFFFFSLPL